MSMLKKYLSVGNFKRFLGSELEHKAGKSSLNQKLVVKQVVLKEKYDLCHTW